MYRKTYGAKSNGSSLSGNIRSFPSVFKAFYTTRSDQKWRAFVICNTDDSIVWRNFNVTHWNLVVRNAIEQLGGRCFVRKNIDFPANALKEIYEED